MLYRDGHVQSLDDNFVVENMQAGHTASSSASDKEQDYYDWFETEAEGLNPLQVQADPMFGPPGNWSLGTALSREWENYPSGPQPPLVPWD
jgi:hypothetical protein